MTQSEKVMELINKGRIDYIENKGKEPTHVWLRPEEYCKLGFIHPPQKEIKVFGMILGCSTMIIEKTMVFYFYEPFVYDDMKISIW